MVNYDSKHLWPIAGLNIATVILIVFGIMPTIMLSILPFSLAAITYATRIQTPGKPAITSGLWFFVFVSGIAIGLSPMADYPTLIDNVILHEAGKPFTLTPNLAKAIAGWILFFALWPIIHQSTLSRVMNPLLTVFAFTVLVLTLAFFVIPLKVHFKPFAFIGIFSVTNLVFDVVSEEVFMRVLLQGALITVISSVIKNRIIQQGLPLILATLVFHFTHLMPSFELQLAFTFTGFCYALLYALYKNLSLCIALHFLVNVCHFAFFTYPL